MITVLRIAGGLSVVYGLVQTAVGILKGAAWWLGTVIGAALLGANAFVGDPMSVFLQVALGFIGAGIGNLLTAGVQFFQAAGLSAYADYQQQSNMPIDAWCAQYGGCPTPNPAKYNN